MTNGPNGRDPGGGAKALQSWSDEAVHRFWEWSSRHSTMQEEYFSKGHRDALVRFLSLAVGQLRDRSILDYGCGLGYFLEGLLDAGAQCRGLDSSNRSVDVVNDRFLGRPGWLGAVLQAEAGGHGLKEQSFDIITCIETIEHLGDHQLDDVLRDIFGLLRPGGHAFFTTPNDEDLSATANYCPFCDTSFHPMQHVRSFTAESLSRVLAGRGFDVVLCSPTNLPWFVMRLPASPLDWSARHLGSALMRRLARGLDTLAPRPPARGRELRRYIGTGPHLTAVAIKAPARNAVFDHDE